MANDDVRDDAAEAQLEKIGRLVEATQAVCMTICTVSGVGVPDVPRVLSMAAAQGFFRLHESYIRRMETVQVTPDGQRQMIQAVKACAADVCRALDETRKAVLEEVAALDNPPTPTLQ
jgi:hypothetical protein